MGKTGRMDRHYKSTDRRKSGTESGKSSGWLWTAAFVLLLCMQILLMIYYGGKKTGFHEDEYYSYYSTNRTAGLYEPDREWVDRDSFRNEFVVLPGEGFRYGLVATVQSWDVHPPFFYFILHTACSLFPGVFSKWLGIGVNLVAFALNFGLLSWLAYMVTGRDKWLTIAVVAVHGFNPVIVSGVMFIRMYEWLTVFVLLCACLHVRAVIKKQAGAKSFLLPLMLVNYLGFLTQYYYIIFLFFMAAGFCLWNVLPCVGKKTGKGGSREKACLWDSVRECVEYGCACGVSLALAVLSYPASLSHIFRGYRGTGAVSEFLNTANTDERLGFFAGLVNEYLFDGYFWLWFFLIILMGGAVSAVRRREKRREVSALSAGADIPAREQNRKETAGKEGEAAVFLLLLFTVCGYFFTVAKTALLLYETSNRYQLPVYGIMILLVITAVYGLWKELAGFCCGENSQRLKRLSAAGGAALLVLFLAGDVHEFLSGKMIFLYEEEKEDVAYAREHAQTPVIILYNDATPYHVWWRSQELMEYDRLYFVSEGNKEQITDEIICGSDRVIVYAADYDTQEESLAMILESIPGLTQYRLVSQKSLWSVYEFD